MRRHGLEGRAKKRWRATTIADPDAVAAADRIQPAFAPGGPTDAGYVGDITYIWAWEGWAYLATVIDLATRRIVGWRSPITCAPSSSKTRGAWPSSSGTRRPG